MNYYLICNFLTLLFSCSCVLKKTAHYLMCLLLGGETLKEMLFLCTILCHIDVPPLKFNVEVMFYSLNL